MKRLVPARTALLVVDVQEKLLPAMPEGRARELVQNVSILLSAARELGVRVVASEQYPKGLGPTVAPLREALGQAGVSPIEKLSFDALGEPNVEAALFGSGDVDAVVVAGMETHICVFQTARSLATRGVDTYVVADAVSSRKDLSWSTGLELCTRAGAVCTLTETVAFDWLEKAGTPAFKAVSRLVR